MSVEPGKRTQQCQPGTAHVEPSRTWNACRPPHERDRDRVFSLDVAGPKSVRACIPCCCSFSIEFSAPAPRLYRCDLVTARRQSAPGCCSTRALVIRMTRHLPLYGWVRSQVPTLPSCLIRNGWTIRSGTPVADICTSKEPTSYTFRPREGRQVAFARESHRTASPQICGETAAQSAQSW
jgi:hypothetical protein